VDGRLDFNFYSEDHVTLGNVVGPGRKKYRLVIVDGFRLGIEQLGRRLVVREVVVWTNHHAIWLTSLREIAQCVSVRASVA
jgi:hypothetical protein